jgi:hypothetical protein
LGTITAATGPGNPAIMATSSVCHGVPSPLIRIDAWLPSPSRARMFSRASLPVRGDRVFEVEDNYVGPAACGLAEPVGVVAGHEEKGPRDRGVLTPAAAP